MNPVMVRRPIFLVMLLVGNVPFYAWGLVHSVTDFRLDYIAAPTDLIQLDPGWGDSLLIDAQSHEYKSSGAINLSDCNTQLCSTQLQVNKGFSGSSAVAAVSGRFQFKVAYVAYNSSPPPFTVGAEVGQGILVSRSVTIDPDSIPFVSPGATALTGPENVNDVQFGYGATPTPPYYLSFAADGVKYAAYWATKATSAPIRRTTWVDAQSGGPTTWGKNVPAPPAPPVKVAGFGEAASAFVPGSAGTKTVLVYNMNFVLTGVPPRDTFDIRWENLESVPPTSSKVSILRPIYPEDFAIAIDSSGNSLVLWRENAVLWAVAYDSSKQEILAPTQLLANVFINDGITHPYRPYAAISMQRGHFRIAYSYLVGAVSQVFSRSIALNIGTQPYALGPEVLMTPPDDFCIYPDLSVNEKSMVLGWFKRVAPGTAGTYRVMGSIFSRSELTVTLPGRVDLDFGNEDVTFSGVQAKYYLWIGLKTASVAMDDKGNVLVAYDNGFNAKAALVTNASIYYDSAVFVSKILPVSNTSMPLDTINPAIDSVDFLSLVGNDTTRLSLQLAVSPSKTFSGASAAFLPLTTHKIVAAGYYRYRAVLYTQKLPDPALTNRITPKLKSLDLKMNVKPRLPSVDSIKLGSAAMKSFNAGSQPFPLITRKDSLTLLCTAFDMDDSTLEFRISVGGKLLKSVNGTKVTAGRFTATFSLPPLDTVRKALAFSIVTVDPQGWMSPAVTVTFDFDNIVPTQAIMAFRSRALDSLRIYYPMSSKFDTLTPTPLGLTVIQLNDTLLVKGTYTDGNDDTLTAKWATNSGVMTLKKVSIKDTLSLKFPIDTALPLIDTVTLSIGDKDSTVQFKFLVRPNRTPAVDSIFHSAYKFLDSTWKTGPFDKVKNFDSDTGLIVPLGLPTILDGSGTDIDRTVGDNVELKWITWRPNSGCAPRGNLSCYTKTDSVLGTKFQRTFSAVEEYVTLRATDLSGAFVERIVWMEYPVVDTTGSGPTNLAAAIKTLTGELKFILEGKTRDTTVKVELASSGTGNLQILSVATKTDNQKWLDLKLDWTSGLDGKADSLRFKGSTATNAVTPGKLVRAAPNTKFTFSFTFSSDSLRGDSTLSDTLLVQTSDFSKPLVKIPFKVKYDDFPVIRISIPGVQAAGPDNAFNNAGLPKLLPARSNLAFAFSETVKVKDPVNAFKIYSLLDKIKNPNGFRSIPGDFAYRSKRTGLGKISAAADSLADTIIFTPRYSQPSDSMRVTPPPGHFIYRDILQIQISNIITDKSGNSLDLRLDRLRKVAGTVDTIFQAQVDTGFFKVMESQPAPNTVGWDPDKALRVRFNRKLSQRPPVGSDNLTLLNLKAFEPDSNHALSVTSVFYGTKRYGFQFLALENGDSTLVFRTRPRFLALDTVTVVLSGGLMDTTGLSLDGNGNRFPNWLYNQKDTTDQYSFTFYTMNQEFYLFPNPYRFSDSRHREKGNITFKNLNVLKGFVPNQEVILRIHSMTGDLIYSSHDGEARRTPSPNRLFNTLDWDLKTRSGATIGTGVYVFTLITGNSKLLRKGKVAVVR